MLNPIQIRNLTLKAPVANPGRDPSSNLASTTHWLCCFSWLSLYLPGRNRDWEGWSLESLSFYNARTCLGSCWQTNRNTVSISNVKHNFHRNYQLSCMRRMYIIHWSKTLLDTALSNDQGEIIRSSKHARIQESQWMHGLPDVIHVLQDLFAFQLMSLKDKRAHLRHLLAQSWSKVSLTNTKAPIVLVLYNYAFTVGAEGPAGQRPHTITASDHANSQADGAIWEWPWKSLRKTIYFLVYMIILKPLPQQDASFHLQTTAPAYPMLFGGRGGSVTDRPTRAVRSPPAGPVQSWVWDEFMPGSSRLSSTPKCLPHGDEWPMWPASHTDICFAQATWTVQCHCHAQAHDF